MYVLMNRETGMYATADPHLGGFHCFQKSIRDAWIIEDFNKAHEESQEGWTDCDVVKVPTQYVNILQCAPMFEFMEGLKR